MESDFLQSASVASGSAFAGGVNASPADGCFGDVELKTKFFLGGAQNLGGFAHYFVADAVAGKRCDLEYLHKSKSGTAILIFFAAVTMEFSREGRPPCLQFRFSAAHSHDDSCGWRD